jgi:hypothetical protein
MSRRWTRGAAALPAAVMTLLVSTALGVAIADLVHTEVALARQRLLAARALAAADACVARVVAALPAGWDFGPELAGAGLPAPTPGCRLRARPAPGPAEPPRLLLEIAATAGRGTRAVEALVGRTPAPGVAALLWLATPPGPGTVGGSLALAGVDPLVPDAPGWAALAAPAIPDALDAWLVGQPGVTIAPGTAAPRAAPPPPLAALVARLVDAGAPGAEALVEAAGPAPSRALVRGNLAIASPAHGAGLLVIDGTLDVDASLSFTGLVVVTGGLRVARGATLAVDGALWLAPGAGPQPFAVDGDAVVRRRDAALAAAGGLLPLPRPAILLGQRDLDASDF